MNADLQREYGRCLTDMYEGRVSVLDVADWAAYLPRGSAVSEWIGGWGAVSGVEEDLRRVEHLLQLQMVQASGKKRNVPLPKAPGSLREAKIKQLKEARAQVAKSKRLAAMSKLYGG